MKDNQTCFGGLSPASLSTRGYGLGIIAALLISLLIAGPGQASIRMDGSEFQGSSAVAGTTTALKTVAGKDAKLAMAAFPSKIIVTLGQPVMARGVLPSGETGSSAFKIGLGYEYNVWKTAGLDCQCGCFGDPVCDGMHPDVADVSATIAVAFRGSDPTKDAGCLVSTSDVDCNGVVDIMDVVTMIIVAFRGGNPVTSFCDPCK